MKRWDLFGSRMHVWAEGVEWWTETRQCIFLVLLSAALCFPSVMAAQLAFAIIRVPASTLPLTFALPVFFPCWKILQDWRRYLRMYKDEWTYLLEHKCPNMWLHKSAIVNLGETAPGFICLATMDNLHQRNWIEVYRIFLFLTWANK